MRAVALVTGFFLAVLCVVGCGSEKIDVANRDFSDAELATMVLRADDLGGQYAGFERTDDSGFQSNDQVVAKAGDQEDQDDAFADVKRFGRLNGYEEDYMSTAAIISLSGVFLVSTNVDLLDDGKNGSGYLQNAVDDALRDMGKADNGVKLEQVSEFDPGKIGQEAKGMIITMTSTDNSVPYSMHGTMIGFRRGRIIGGVAIFRLDDQSTRAEAVALAEKLNDHIGAVINGSVPILTLAPTPTPTPAPANTTLVSS